MNGIPIQTKSCLCDFHPDDYISGVWSVTFSDGVNVMWMLWRRGNSPWQIRWRFKYPQEMRKDKGVWAVAVPCSENDAIEYVRAAFDQCKKYRHAVANELLIHKPGADAMIELDETQWFDRYIIFDSGRFYRQPDGPPN